MQILADFGISPALILAGALGGVIRWASARDNARFGALHVLVGGIVGNYIGPTFFGLVDAGAAIAGIEPQVARLAGAHIVGYLGIAAYTFLREWFKSRSAVPPASPGKEDTP